MTDKLKGDWGNFFKPEDFDASFGITEVDYDCYVHIEDMRWVEIRERARDAANEIIRKELEKAPRVYGTFTEDLKRAKFSGPLDWTERYHPQPSHTARLICIEEIKRDPISDPNKGD